MTSAKKPNQSPICNQIRNIKDTDDVDMLLNTYTFPQVLNSIDQQPKSKRFEYMLKLQVILCNKRTNEWLWSNIENSEVENAHLLLLSLLYDIGAVKHFVGKEDIGYVEEDFTGHAYKATICMNCLRLITKSLRSLDETNAVVKVPHSLHTKIILKSFLLSAEHYNQIYLWGSTESWIASNSLVEEILKICDKNDLRDFFCGDSEREDGYFVKIFTEIKPKLVKQQWKQYPAVKRVFHLCLKNICRPHTSDHIDRLLPFSLMLSDDHQLENKVLGVSCLHHIIQHCSMAELSWYGRCDVMFDAVLHLLYTHEAEMLKILLPCIVGLLKVYDSTNKTDIVSENKRDIVIRRILTDMMLEDNLPRRRVYVEFLPKFIIDVSIVKHLKQLMEVISSYLQIYDGENETSRIGTLKVLDLVILTAWPRINPRIEEISKVLLRLLYDINAKDFVVTDHAVEEIQNLCSKCMRHLREVSPDKVTKILKEAEELNIYVKLT